MSFVDGLMGAIAEDNTYAQKPQNPQNPSGEVEKGNFVDIVDIVRSSFSAEPPASDTDASGNRWEAHWRSVCPDYWQGCLACPDASLVHTDGPMAGALNSDFCRRHAPPSWARERVQGVLQ